MVNENLVKEVVKEPYKYGFITDIETEKIEKGLNEDIIKLISQKKEEPKFLQRVDCITDLRKFLTHRQYVI